MTTILILTLTSVPLCGLIAAAVHGFQTVGK